MIYTEDEVKKKKEKYDSVNNTSLPQWNGKYDAQRLSALEKIANAEDFSYNPAADPVYNSYKQSYIDNGERAMRDTVANAALLSGGNTNSYAVTAGAEAYGNYLKKADEIIPELQALALKRYQANLDKDESVYDIYNELYESERDMYEKDLADYYKRLAELRTDFITAYNTFENERDYKNQNGDTKKSSGYIRSAEKSSGVAEFKNTVMTPKEFSKSAYKAIFKDYRQYWLNMVSQWYLNKRITKDEKDFLLEEVNNI